MENSMEDYKKISDSVKSYSDIELDLIKRGLVDFSKKYLFYKTLDCPYFQPFHKKILKILKIYFQNDFQVGFLPLYCHADYFLLIDLK